MFNVEVFVWDRQTKMIVLGIEKNVAASCCHLDTEGSRLFPLLGISNDLVDMTQRSSKTGSSCRELDMRIVPIGL